MTIFSAAQWQREQSRSPRLEPSRDSGRLFVVLFVLKQLFNDFLPSYAFIAWIVSSHSSCAIPL